jgi:ABC-type sugar transport system substrate-binding protein
VVILYALRAMFAGKLAVFAGLLAVGLSACGSSSKPLAGSAAALAGTHLRGRIDDPRATHIQCLRAHGVTVNRVGQTGLRIGTAPGGPTVTFEPTAGAAQDAQIRNREQGAEVIGPALLYPDQASDAELSTIEQCLAQGVKG